MAPKPPRSLGHPADEGAADRDESEPGVTDPSPGDLAPGDLSPAEALSKLLRRLAVTGLRLLSLCQNLDRPEDRVVLIQAAEDLDEIITEIRRISIASLAGSD